MFPEIVDHDLLQLGVEVFDDIGQQIMRHGPGRLHAVDATANGPSFIQADDDRELPLAVTFGEDDDLLIVVVTNDNAGEVHSDVHVGIPRIGFRTPAGERLLVKGIVAQSECQIERPTRILNAETCDPSSHRARPQQAARYSLLVTGYFSCFGRPRSAVETSWPRRLQDTKKP